MGYMAKEVGTKVLDSFLDLYRIWGCAMWVLCHLKRDVEEKCKQGCRMDSKQPNRWLYCVKNSFFLFDFWKT